MYWVDALYHTSDIPQSRSKAPDRPIIIRATDLRPWHISEEGLASVFVCRITFRIDSSYRVVRHGYSYKCQLSIKWHLKQVYVTRFSNHFTLFSHPWKPKERLDRPLVLLNMFIELFHTSSSFSATLAHIITSHRHVLSLLLMCFIFTLLHFIRTVLLLAEIGCMHVNVFSCTQSEKVDPFLSCMVNWKYGWFLYMIFFKDDYYKTYSPYPKRRHVMFELYRHIFNASIETYLSNMSYQQKWSEASQTCCTIKPVLTAVLWTWLDFCMMLCQTPLTYGDSRIERMCWTDACHDWSLTGRLPS